MASSGNSKMPEDLLIDILARLPVKSLLRFKCVNKYWNALIESPNFITTHHDRSPAMLLVLRYVNQRDILRDPDPDCPSDRLICEFLGYDIVSNDEFDVVGTSNRFAPIADINSSDDECNTCTTSNKGDTNFNAVGNEYSKSSGYYWNANREEEDEANNKEFALAMFRDDDINNLKGQPQPETPPYEDIIDIIDMRGYVNHLQTITGPVDGLFLLHNGCGFLHTCYNRLALWNPATTELRLLPLPDFNFFFPNPSCIYVFGFGLDLLTNNYKVVWIPGCGSSNPEPEPPNVAVYSLDTNSWRHFNAVLPSVAQMYHSESTYLNGAYYWLSQHAIDQWKQRIKVVLFDMGNDVFREIQIPDDFTRNLKLGVHDVKLVVHNDDSIALLVYEYITGILDSILDSIDMWVMKQEEEGCWTKLFTLGLGPHLRLEKALGFWKNNTNTILFTATNTNEFVLNNTDTDETSHLGIQCDPDPFIYNYSPTIFNYKESLVSVGGQKKCCKRGKLHAMVQDFFAFQLTPP